MEPMMKRLEDVVEKARRGEIVLTELRYDVDRNGISEMSVKWRERLERV